MSRTSIVGVVLLGASLGAAAAQPKQVEITNEMITVTGEVTATLDTPVTISEPIVIAEPVEVTGEVTVGNTIGVDVLSLPPGGSSVTNFTNVNAQLVTSDSTLDVGIGGIPPAARLLSADIEVLFTGSGHNCLAQIQFQRDGGPFQTIGRASNQGASRAQRTLEFDGLSFGPGDVLRIRMIRATGGGNCVGDATIFYES